jgi:hypothetical protein
MKRSLILNHISNDLKDIIQENYIDEKGYEWCANLILLKLEELGFARVESREEYTAVIPYEPEEGWEAWIEEQDKKDEARDFKVYAEENGSWNRSKQVALDFLQGKSFEELAKEYNVTRERIRQIVAKERRRYQKYMEESGE